MKTILVCALLVLLALVAIGQKQNDCGTKTPAQPLRFSEERMERALMAPTATYPLLMKVIVHIIADDNGSNVPAPDSAVLRQMENMRQFYAPHNICFILAGINRINNSDLWSHNVDTEASELIPFLVPNMMNIFVHGDLFDNDDDLNGSAYNIPNYYLSIVGTAVTSLSNRSTMAHEMGHDFGLYHTFETVFGQENVTRSGSCKDCDVDGDLLCDTQADRNLDDEMINEGDCNYNGNAQDACNEFLLMTPTNIMTYGRRSCRDHFTSGQGARARLAIEDINFLTLAIAPDLIAIVLNTSLSAGVHFYLSRTRIDIASPSFVISGSASVRMSSKEVVFNPGVTLSPTGNGFTQVWANTVCN